MRKRTDSGISDLRADFNRRKQAIRARLEEFRGVAREEHFYELAYCLLTPQSSAANAALAIHELREAACFDRPGEAALVLQRKAHYIRFHNTKARRLAEAWIQYPTVAAKLAENRPAEELRQWLVMNVKGIGWKEASHFLRNIGYRDLAILDRHILKNLKKHGIIRSMPKTLTPKRYITIETNFAKFAREIGITIDELDLLFWSRETGEILK
jgi:N-glycosylase/DNA lyase